MSRHHKRKKRFTPSTKTIIRNVPRMLPPGTYSVTLVSIEMDKVRQQIVSTFNFNDALPEVRK